MSIEDFRAVTFSSKGYIAITENLFESINQNNVNLKIELYALDEETYNYFYQKYPNIEVNNEIFFNADSNLFNYFDDKFGEIMLKKFHIIFSALNKSKYVLYLDGDIVVKKDIKNYLQKYIGEADIVFQNDKRPSKPNQINLCAGFMYIRSNKKTLRFFDPEKMPVKKIVNYKTHDQTHINKSKAKFKYKVLPLDIFPNDPHFYNNNSKIDPAIIHFNYLVGNEKIDKIKSYGEWYIS